MFTAALDWNGTFLQQNVAKTDSIGYTEIIDIRQKVCKDDMEISLDISLAGTA